jgi:hypothetical protein
MEPMCSLTSRADELKQEGFQRRYEKPTQRNVKQNRAVIIAMRACDMNRYINTGGDSAKLRCRLAKRLNLTIPTNKDEK